MKEVHINLSSMRSLFVEMYFGDVKLATGTAFVVSSGDLKGLATNRHNLTGRDQQTGKALSQHGGVPDKIVVWHNATTTEKDRATWISVPIDLYAEGRRTWLEHPKLGHLADIAIVPIGDTFEIQTYPYDLESIDEIIERPADPISVIGFPFGKSAGGLFAIWAGGFIASEPDVMYDDLPITLIDCRTRQGQSGSPVVIQRNEAYWGSSGLMRPFTRAGKTQLIGMYSGRILPESDIGMVWRTSAIRETLEQSSR